MSRNDVEQLKSLLISALKPFEQKLSVLFNKIDSLSSELCDLKTVILAKNIVDSSKVVNNCEQRAAHAPPTQISTSNSSTPTSRPAPAQAPSRIQRPAATRTKEKIATQANQQKRTKRTDQPAKHEPQQSMAAAKITTNMLKTDNCSSSTLNPTDISINNALSNDTSRTAGHDYRITDHEPQTCDDGFQPVQSRYQRRKNLKISAVIKGTATDISLKGVEMHKYLHGCYFKTDTTPDSVINHLKSIHNGVQYTAEKIQSKRDTYNSFKIGIPAAVYEKFLSTSVWPVNTSISEWRPFLRPREAEPPSDNCAPGQNK